MGYEQQGLSGIGIAKPYQEPNTQRKETELEGLLNKFETLNKDSHGIVNRLQVVSDKLRNEPLDTNPENDAKIPQAGIVSRLNILLNDYQETIRRNQQSIGRLESII